MDSLWTAIRRSDLEKEARGVSPKRMVAYAILLLAHASQLEDRRERAVFVWSSIIAISLSLGDKSKKENGDIIDAPYFPPSPTSDQDREHETGTFVAISLLSEAALSLCVSEDREQSDKNLVRALTRLIDMDEVRISFSTESYNQIALASQEMLELVNSKGW